MTSRFAVWGVSYMVSQVYDSSGQMFQVGKRWWPTRKNFTVHQAENLMDFGSLKSKEVWSKSETWLIRGKMLRVDYVPPSEEE